MVQNRWNENDAKNLSGLDELVYRSNLLGQDRSIANIGGGNTSTKSMETDFKGEEVEVMWVKGSGSDLATMKRENFTGLKMEDIRPLLEKEDMSDDEMVDYLGHFMIDANHPRSFIDTLLHAFLPYKHVDHTLPDSIISIAYADNGYDIAKAIFGDRFVWVPYIRPGFKLSKMIADGVKNNLKAELVIMEKHGLVTWVETSEESYNKTLEIIQEAENYIEAKVDEKELFGGKKYETLSKNERENLLAQILPVIRGEVSENEKMIVNYDDSDSIQTFVNSNNAKELSQIGAACPDHLVHTKRSPLYVEWNPDDKEDVDKLITAIKEGISAFKEEYTNYFKRNKSSGDKMFEAIPRVILIPGI